MRRVQSILLIVALLAIPMSLVARGGACERTQCMCCLTHAKQAHGKTLSCSHCTGRGQCGIGSAAPDYGLNAPLAPTAPMPQAALAEPVMSGHVLAHYPEAVPSGFFSAPFEPPRG
jgi:hypothetical protein